VDRAASTLWAGLPEPSHVTASTPPLPGRRHGGTVTAVARASGGDSDIGQAPAANRHGEPAGLNELDHDRPLGPLSLLSQ
jgi:hypothetical protein